MDVYVEAFTPNACEVISCAAGGCYGKDDVSLKRIEHTFNAGHWSVFEHASFTVRIEGISRACSHQLVRHRMASYSQESQRYCKVDTTGHGWYVIPPEILYSENLKAYAEAMGQSARVYHALIDAGIKPEDARYVLPNATKTTITMTMNLRSFFNFLDLRCAKSAQVEIKELANAIREALCCASDDFGFILDLYKQSKKD